MPELELVESPLNMLTANPYIGIALISLLISMAVGVLVVGIYRQRAYREVRSRLDEMNGSSIADINEPSLTFSERVIQPMGRSLVTRLGRMTPSGNLEQIRAKLVAAGNPGNLAVIDFLGLKMLAAIGLALLTSFYMLTQDGTTATKTILVCVGGGLLGLYLPNFWLNQKINQRKEEIGKALPDALDMLTTMVDAGLGFDMALMRLCDKWDNPLTYEFGRMVTEMRMGVGRTDALRHLVERVDVAEVSTFAATIIQADHLGISIGHILHTQSEQIRMKRRQWVEEKAAQLPLKMLPIITFFIFPALFAIILGPAVPGLLESFGGM